MNQMSFAARLAAMCKAGFQAFEVNTVEEGRCLAAVKHAAKLLAPVAPAEAPGPVPWRVITWSFHKGFSAGKKCEGNPLLALQALATSDFDEGQSDSPHTVFVFHDMAAFLNADTDPRARRALRDLCENGDLCVSGKQRPIVFTVAVPISHPEVAPLLTPLEFGLPGRDEFLEAIDEISAAVEISSPGKGQPGNDLRKRLAEGLSGFTYGEATNALALLAGEYGGFNHPPAGEEALLRGLYRHQAALWKKDEVLELYDTETVADRGGIGGYETYLEYVDDLKHAFSEEAEKLGVQRPKGIALAGLPGGGKSVVAFATARMMGLPLILFKTDALFKSLVGETEANLRKALSRIEAKGPCVVVFDEVDKMFGGMADSSGGDSGVSARVLGEILSWQANRNKYALVLMTMNRVKGLPPELLRAGRIDKVFFADLPTQAEREAILQIHLKKRNVGYGDKLSAGDVVELAKNTEGFTGAELEQIVIEAQRRRFRLSDRKVASPTREDLMEARESAKPLSILDKTGVDEIRNFFQGRAVNVAAQKQVAAAGKGRRRAVDSGPSNN